MNDENCLENVRWHLENAESRENQIILSSEFFHALLKCLGIIAALLDSGKVYEAREILGELGESIYQNMKSGN
jgi:hypothetical protein